MSNVTFEIKGTDELAGKIRGLLIAYPSETEKELEKISNDFKRDVNSKFKHLGQDKPNMSAGKPVAKAWKKRKLKGQYSGMTTGVTLTNKAPHFHLVENGHQEYVNPGLYAAYKAGKLQSANKSRKSSKRGSKNGMIHIGFVPGKHYCEKTRNEWNNGEFKARVEKHVNRLMKKQGLV